MIAWGFFQVVLNVKNDLITSLAWIGTMTPERWQQIENILDEVMPLATEERAARISRLCRGDAALRSEVEEMMGFCDQVQAESFLEAPPHLAAQDLLGSVLAEPRVEDLSVGTSIGPYTIVEHLGHGGMGEVYLAERADPHMRVALKVVKRGMDTNEILQRFRYEREILARLNHPNIAQLYGGGVTEDGRPYFAMEYVEGKTLEAYCDDNHLSIAERLALFKTVCEAVRYAHRNLVVHRDLKPGNILVSEGEAGQPLVKLLDFGIAKLLEEDASLHTVPMTQAGALRLTPGYAAPEQVRGQHTTPATDVYALGVILYRLLTGRRPYYFEDRSVTSIESVICLRMPDRPSTVVVRPLRSSGDGAAETTPEDVSRHRAVSPKMLRRQLAGDLDAITMMALRKESERRYASAAEFLDDIERYLDNRPVVAQHDSVAYRTAKFVQRHTAGVGITAAMVLLITALVTFYTVQLAHQRNLAEQEATRAIATRDFMVGTFALADPEAVPDPRAVLDDTFTKRELIEANLARIDELSDPLDKAVVWEGMANAYTSYGAFDIADSLFSRSLAAKTDVLGPEHSEVAISLQGRAVALLNLSKRPLADSLSRRALEIRRKTLGEVHQLVHENLNFIAYIQLWNRQWSKAETWYRDALDVSVQLETTDADTTTLRVNTAESLNGLARALREQGALDEAERLFRRALAIRRTWLGEEEHPKVANTLHDLANCLRERGVFEEAETYHHEALAIYKKNYGHEHPTIATSNYSLAILYQERGDVERAKTHYREAIDIYEKTGYHSWRPYPLIRLGMLLIGQNEIDEAGAVIEEGLSAGKASRLPETNMTMVLGNILRGAILTQRGRFEEAEQVLKAAYQIVETTPEPPQDVQREALQRLVALYEAWQKPDKAESYRTLLTRLAPSA